MRYLTLLLAVFFTSYICTAQKTSSNGTLDFDGSAPWAIWIYNDTISNPACIWQIGSPQKAIFTQGHMSLNAMVTDTINTYPINDRSSFIIGQVPNIGWFLPHTARLQGWYAAHTDSLSDYGYIEVSLNNGQNWRLISYDSSYFQGGSANLPILTGNSNGWQHFYIDFRNLALQFPPKQGDTILLRFTFISDSTQTNKDGLMFDNLELLDFFEAVSDVLLVNSSVFPNPTEHTITIVPTTSFHFDKARLSILNVLGQEVYKSTPSPEKPITVNIQQLPQGLYFYDVKFDSAKKLMGKFQKL